MAAGELTEWEEMQIRLGNREAPKDYGKKKAANWKEEDEETKRWKKFDKLVMDNLDKLEEDDDEAVLRVLREKRMAELKAKAEREKYGSLEAISETEYTQEVTEAKNVMVVVLLVKQGIHGCELLEDRVRKVARRFKATKFVSIHADAAIRNYPDENLPTLLVYFNGQIVGQVIGLSTIGGDDCSESDVEWALHKLKAIEGSELEEDPRGAPKITRVGAAKRTAFAVGSDDEDELDEDDW